MPTAAQPLIDTLSEDMPDLLRPIKVQKRCASAGPILQVKSGSVTVPVYRCGDGRLPRFFIAYYRNGQRVRQSFSTIDEAKREAQVAARQIAAGLAKATGLSIAEREGNPNGAGGQLSRWESFSMNAERMLSIQARVAVSFGEFLDAAASLFSRSRRVTS